MKRRQPVQEEEEEERALIRELRQLRQNAREFHQNHPLPPPGG
jgi:hypothetical protein